MHCLTANPLQRLCIKPSVLPEINALVITKTTLLKKLRFFNVTRVRLVFAKLCKTKLLQKLRY